jgi:hypothetical protein
MCCAVIVGGFWLGVDQESVAGNECVTPLHDLIISHYIVRIFKLRVYNGLRIQHVLGSKTQKSTNKIKCYWKVKRHRWYNI